jgi:glycosyltransferase involved in cell wall biosynthesis
VDPDVIRGYKIAIVAPRYPPSIGGIESHVEALAEGLVRRGASVEVVVTDPTGGLSGHDHPAGVMVHRFPTVRGDETFFLSPKLFRWLLRNAHLFDIIHAHSYHTPLAFAAWFAARRKRVPFLITPHYHGGGHTRLRRALHIPYGPIGKVMMRGSAAVVCVSRAEELLVKAHFGSRIPTVVIPNGVDTDEIRAARPVARKGGPIILVVGRLERYKGVDRVVDALRWIGANGRVIVVGDGPEKSRLEHLAAEIGVRDRLDLIGRVTRSELLAWYKSADVVVSLSDHEAFGLVVLEAAVAGTPVVASDIPAHREVRDYVERSAITLVPRSVSGRALGTVIADVARRGRISQGLERVPTWDQMSGQVAQLYVRMRDGPGNRTKPVRR